MKLFNSRAQISEMVKTMTMQTLRGVSRTHATNSMLATLIGLEEPKESTFASFLRWLFS